MDEQFELRLAGDLGRDEGIATAVEHADEVIDDWSETAYHFILLFAASTAKFTCPQVRSAAEAAGFPVPPTAYAWGGPMQRAARAGRIRRCGYVQHGDKTMHTQGVALWETIK